MNNKLLKFSLVCATGAFIVLTNPKTVMAYEEPVAGFTYDKDSPIIVGSANGTIINSFALEDIPIPGYNNIGIANVDTNLIVRSGPGEDQKMIGKLPKNGGCEILEEKDGWSKITSGKVTGYVKSEFLITGTEANRLAKEVGSYVATANEGGLRVREKPSSTDTRIIDLIGEGEELIVLDSKILNYDDEYAQWVKVSLDSDDNENGTEAYVAKDFVNISFELTKAVTLEELEYGEGVSSLRVKLINLAKDHLGEAYVWGGTSLGRGVDCSGFTQALYRQLGISIPRTSRAQASGGIKISASDLKPGDLVFYGSSSYINHVAMYIGNGRVIHASNRRDGIKISNMNYRQPVRYARYLGE